MGKFTDGLRKFSAGRYGSDQLNRTLVIAAVIFNILAAFIPFLPVKLPLIAITYVMLGVAVFRMLSRNTWKRFDENKRYVAFLARLRDRDHRYYRCPKCRQKVRVPKHKGKISITCPKCKEKFIRKT